MQARELAFLARSYAGLRASSRRHRLVRTWWPSGTHRGSATRVSQWPTGSHPGRPLCNCWVRSTAAPGSQWTLYNRTMDRRRNKGFCGGAASVVDG
jgi:hypothetical protein